MYFENLNAVIKTLELKGELKRIKHEVDPNVQMAAIHLENFYQKGPALLFENIKGTQYKALSNLYSSEVRQEILFGDIMHRIKTLIDFKQNPQDFFKYFKLHFKDLISGFYHAKPKLESSNSIRDFQKIKIQDLPLIKHWPMDGGAFLTLPQVYSENVLKPGIQHSNLGMYRIQLNGNNYLTNQEVGLHYQIHRGLGVHHTIAKKCNKPLKVSIFVGGPPAHTLAAILPLPEDVPEVFMAGVLAQKRFRYCYWNDYLVSLDADFVILGTIADDNKPEGPFGDHLGYYSLTHPFPYLKVDHVLAKKDAILPFTVVGRPPQEDTAFGNLIHKMTGKALQFELPGLKELRAVDEAGVHPLALAITKERYTPFLNTKKPAESLTIGFKILGTGQLSLTKYLALIPENESVQHIENNYFNFFRYLLEHLDFENNLHFISNTSIDTLDYSGGHLNQGSKLMLCASVIKHRALSNRLPTEIKSIQEIKKAKLLAPGILIFEIDTFKSYELAETDILLLTNKLGEYNDFNSPKSPYPLCILTENIDSFNHFNDFLWIVFTRSNPSHDIYGVNAFYKNKQWGCKGSMLIDVRLKPFMPPILKMDPTLETFAKIILQK
ncbi:MAG: UbiD family decarboxylase [Alphaproteobacteria bacterium]|nr:UbiD family decarboxylase [Alphaproteobacteria bacterium]